MADDRQAGSIPTRPALPGGRVGSLLTLLRNRGFRSLVLAAGASALGDWIGFLAIIALTHDILGTTRAAAFAVSGVMAARVLPSLLLGPIAGVFVDRWDRRRVLAWTAVCRALVTVLIPFTNEVLTLLLATLLIEAMASLFGPARDATLPTLVRRGELVAANQINLVVTYGTLPLGGALYAALVGLAGTFSQSGTFLAERPVAVPIWFTALLFSLSAPLLAGVRFPSPAAAPASRDAAPGAWSELKEGLRFVGGHPVIRALIVGVMVAFAAAGVVITSGEFFARQLNAGQSGYGVLVAVVGTGLLAGLLLAAPLTQRLGSERLFGPGIGLAGTALVATATMPTLTLASIPAALMGACAGVAFIVGYTILQQRADDRVRGRTFGAFNSGVRLAILGSTVAVPTMIGLLGPERRVLMTLEDGTQALQYPYVFGGVRITLIAAGVLALVGALGAGRTLRHALLEERAAALQLPSDVGEPRPVGGGVLVVFEGGDGAGKSTQIRLLRSVIERAGYDALVTREPGGTPIGEQVRDVLLSRGSEAMSPHTEALLYAAARAQHVDEVIRPALEKGMVVLCDRFTDSSLVYQGVARELGVEQVAELNRWATHGLEPDLVILLDLEATDGLRRASDGRSPDRLEAAGDEFHRRVREAYRRRAESDPARYRVLDAARPVEDVHADVREAVLELLGSSS